MHVAVAGGGIAGLVAAIALAERGFSVDLYERSEEQDDDSGAGIQLSPNAMAVLDRLGITPFLEASLSEPRVVAIHDGPSGRRLTEIPLGRDAVARYGSRYCVIHRGDLQAGLLAAARLRNRIRLVFGAEVRDARGTKSGVAFSVAGERRAADALVAADGLHSRLRIALFRAASPRLAGKTAWRAMLPARDVPAGFALDRTGVWLGPGAHLVHYPVRAASALNVVLIAGAAAEASRPPEQGFGAAARDLLRSVPDWRSWPLHCPDIAPRWVDGRAVLIGDAAHAMLPSAAQGGAQAVEDGWVLAQCLAARPDGIAAALAAYERVRRPRVERVVRSAARNLLLFELAWPASAARNVALRLTSPERHLQRLDWLYAWRPAIEP